MAYHAALNARIVAWLSARPLGAQYGNGECWTLAEDALSHAQARTSRQLTPHFGPGADYVWGEPETDFSAVQPGDIVQLRDYQARLSTTVRDFLGTRPRPPVTIGRRHHTAIVLRVVVAGSLVEVIEQNVPLPGSIRADRVVQINRLALRSVTGPIERRTSDLGEPETSTTTYTVLGGSVRVYHPQPR